MASPPQSGRDLHNGNVVLRSSCDACTDVKMACSKEKPTCARCARRGNVCRYAPVKRAGRKKQRHGPQPQPQSQSLSHPQQQQQKQKQRHQRISENNPADSQNGVDSSIDPIVTQSPNKHMAVASHGDALIQQPISMDWFVPELMDLSTCPVDDSPLAELTGPLSPLSMSASTAIAAMPDHLSLGNTSRSPIGSAGSGYASEKSINGNGSSNVTAYRSTAPGDFTSLDSVDSPAFDETDWLALITSTSSPEQEAIHTSHTLLPTPDSASSILESICTSPPSCMNRALGILLALAPGPETCSGIFRESSTESDQDVIMNLNPRGVNTPTFQEVMKQNQASMDAILPILQCSCAKDSSIVFTLSHVIFRILAWYAACVRLPLAVSCMPVGQHTWLPSVKPPVASSMPGYDMNDEGAQNRVLCQTVLFKMHAVRSSVDILSKILLGQASEANPSRGHFQGRESGSPMNTDRPPSALALSLESQLRCCLRDVSRAIVAKLAEG